MGLIWDTHRGEFQQGLEQRLILWHSPQMGLPYMHLWHINAGIHHQAIAKIQARFPNQATTLPVLPPTQTIWQQGTMSPPPGHIPSPLKSFQSMPFIDQIKSAWALGCWMVSCLFSFHMPLDNLSLAEPNNLISSMKHYLFFILPCALHVVGFCWPRQILLQICLLPVGDSQNLYKPFRPD